ncbi:MAG: CBS domain-containing protein [Methanobacteriota archaeon]
MEKHNEKELITEFYKHSVKDLMDTRTWDMPIVEKNADITTVFTILSGKSHIWVVDNKKTMNIVGVITEHDALSLLSPAYEPSYIAQKMNIRSLQIDQAKTAEDLMSKKPITTTPEENVTDVLTKMNRFRVRRLPVVDSNNTLLGEITLHHLIYKFHQHQNKQ